MQLTTVFGLAVLCCLQGASSQDHPVEKVITLLKGLIEQVDGEGKQEAVTYSKFEYWCQNSVKTLNKAIAEEKATIGTLKSVIKGKMEEESLLGEQITALEAELTKLQAADQKATSVRDAGAALFSEAKADYGDTIEAIAGAITALETAQTNTDSFLLAQRKVQRALELGQAAATEEQRTELAAFVQEPKDRPVLEAAGDYEKHVKKYAFKSSSVIEMLKKLKLKFEDEALEAIKAETNAINAYELAKAARADLAQKATDAKAIKTTEKTDANTARVKAEGELTSELADLQADEATLDETQKACVVKKMEWAERSETRAKELEAMKAAIKILSKATGVRTKAPTNPVPPPSPVGGPVFLELMADPKMRAVQLLRASARSTHSQALERLAQEIAAHLTGPFDQINNMIQKLIFHLMDEQKDEDNHKNWCDLELQKTDESIADKSQKLDELDTKLDEAKASVQQLTSDIQVADQMAEEIAAHMEQATAVRETGKAENQEALKDAQDAQVALSKAIAVIAAFYKDSGMVAKESWEFLQKGVKLPETPTTWDASYTGTSDPMAQPDGILSVLKKVSADFATMEAQTRAQEQSDQSIYEEDMKLCEIEKARRVKQSEEKAQEKKRLIAKISDMTATHKHVSSEHEATEQYLKDLQHACVDGDSTYEDRKAARAKEITALKEAQTILATAFEEEVTTTTGSFLQHRRRPLPVSA